MHEKHREEYGALREQFRIKSRELDEMHKRIRVFEDACVKCGEFITEEHLDWDYDECECNKIEFTICPNCGDKHITYEG